MEELIEKMIIKLFSMMAPSFETLVLTTKSVSLGRTSRQRTEENTFTKSMEW
jgi:hypothetical protein